MRTIGIRAAPREVAFAIFDGEASEVLNREVLRIPAALSVPEGLKYVRSNLLDIIREYDVAKAGIRTTETNAKSPSVERLHLEGVIQEAFASSGLVAYFAGPIATIASKNGFPPSAFKPAVEGENILEVEMWDQMTRVEREAVLAARGAVNA